MEMDQLFRLLLELGCEKLKPNSMGTELSALCPLHSETRRSFSVNADKELFNCYGCGNSGDLKALVMRVKKWKYRQAKAFVKGFGGGAEEFFAGRGFLTGFPEQQRERISESPMPSMFAPYTKSSRMMKARIYLEQRGVEFKNSGLTKTGHEIGYDPKQMRIMFPWCDSEGVFQGCTSRLDFNPQSKELVRYLPYFGLQKGNHLFWGHQTWRDLKPEAYCIVEGEIDAMLVSQLYPETGIVAFALGEARATQQQLELLMDIGGPFLIGLDSDEAGRKMTGTLLHGLQKCITSIVTWPCKDPGECSREQILRTLLRRSWLNEKCLPNATHMLHSDITGRRTRKEIGHGASGSSDGAVHQAPTGAFVIEG